MLLEGVPGVAKTLLANAFAARARRRLPPRAVHARHAAVRPHRHDDAARPASSRSGPGPVFTNVLLADEINRTPPKTQAALLEAMQERQVSVDGESAPAARPVPRRRDAEPDRVRGHLPAARGAARPLPRQARRRLPDEADEVAMLGLAHRGVAPAHARRRAAGRRAGGAARGARAWSTPRGSPTRSSATSSRSCARTRELPSVALGASPRAAVHLLAAAQGRGAPRRPRLRHARRRRRWSPRVLRHRLCCARRPSSSATGPTTRSRPRSQPVPVPR